VAARLSRTAPLWFRSTVGATVTAERSNEITAIFEFLSTLALKGCTVTIDAMGTQTATAARSDRYRQEPVRTQMRFMRLLGFLLDRNVWGYSIIICAQYSMYICGTPHFCGGNSMCFGPGVVTGAGVFARAIPLGELK